MQPNEIMEQIAVRIPKSLLVRLEAEAKRRSKVDGFNVTRSDLIRVAIGNLLDKKGGGR
jgi:metal-responsive CopG/Arc/MetJ family transcriptional regulator